MASERRVRLTEGHAMESGIRCPVCGTYTTLSDIIATGHCRGSVTGDCSATLRVDLVVQD